MMTVRTKTLKALSVKNANVIIWNEDFNLVFKRTIVQL